MSLHFRTNVFAFAVIVAMLAVSSTGWAQVYPTKPVRVVVGFSAGSGADTVARIVAPGLSAALGQQIVVDNRTGAAGNIGAEVGARSAPDGYTLFQSSMTHSVNANIYKNLSYDIIRDFTPITTLVTAPSIIIVHPSLPVKSAAQLVKLAKSRPGAINYASAGTGSSTFLAGEQFKTLAGVNLLHVPYKGGNEAMTSVMSGETSIYFSSLGAAIPHIRQNRVRALLVATPKRIPQLPDVPTATEAGYPKWDAGNWYGLVAPAKTPASIITTLHGAIVTAMKNTDVLKRFDDLGYVPMLKQPAEFAAFIKADVENLGKVVREAGIRPQ